MWAFFWYTVYIMTYIRHPQAHYKCINQHVNNAYDAWQVTDIWCDHLTKLVQVVICGQIVPDVEPYKRDKRKDIIENQCLGQFIPSILSEAVVSCAIK